MSTVHQLAIVHPHVISGGIESFFKCGGFSNIFFMFTPKIGEDSHFD